MLFVLANGACVRHVLTGEICRVGCHGGSVFSCSRHSGDQESKSRTTELHNAAFHRGLQRYSLLCLTLCTDCVNKHFRTTPVFHSRIWLFSELSLLTSHLCLVDAIHCVSKNDTDVAHCDFNVRQTILLFFCRDFAESVCYRMAICYPTTPD